MLAPFWPPQIPPVGITSLKSYLTPRGYEVRVADANIEDAFRQVYMRYFEEIRRMVPKGQQGNLYGIGTDVIKNHFMAHLNRRDQHDQEDRDSHYRLLKTIIGQTYFMEPRDGDLEALEAIAADFFKTFGDYVLRLLEETRPGVFGVSVFSGNAPAAVHAFRLARQRFPKMLNVMGGGIFADHLAPDSPNMAHFLEQTQGYIDKLIVGEGEILFHKLLEGQLPPEQRVYGASDIDNQKLDLTQAPLLDFADLDLRHYPYSTGYVSRSCPFQCAFCSETVMWGRYRRKPIPQAVAEFEKLYERDGTQLFSLADSLLNPVVDELARAFLASPHAIYWDACLRADPEAMDRERTLAWRRGGFYKAWLGLESGSPRVLEMMNKKITVPQIKEVLASLAQAGIKTATLWLIGHPGETEEDFQRTLDLITECKDDIYDAEGTPFWYFPRGQSQSGQWGQGQARLLYPPEAQETLMLQTWVLEGTPTRAETYQRLNRFMAHLESLGIPNPYTLMEMHQADERWRRLHLNAVPSLVEFDGSVYLDECKRLQNVQAIVDQPEEGDFAF
jgi:hypothetical protein